MKQRMAELTLVALNACVIAVRIAVDGVALRGVLGPIFLDMFETAVLVAATTGGIGGTALCDPTGITTPCSVLGGVTSTSGIGSFAGERRGFPGVLKVPVLLNHERVWKSLASDYTFTELQTCPWASPVDVPEHINATNVFLNKLKNFAFFMEFFLPVSCHIWILRYHESSYRG